MWSFSPEDLATIRASGLFDAEWYLKTYPDVAALSMDPVEHYLWFGSRLSRDPSPQFNGPEYLARNSEVAAAGLNPLLHYLQRRSGEGQASNGALGRDQLEPKTVVAAVRSFEGYRQRSRAARTILVVAHIAGDQLFGSERSFLDILDGLARLDANVIAVLPKHVHSYTEAVCRRSCETVVFSYDWWRAGTSLSPDSIRVFESIISERQIDAVHVNTIMLREPLIAASNAGVPSIVHARELIREDKWLAELIGESPERIVEETLTRAEWIIANSNATATSFHKEGRTFVVPNTIDFEEFDIPNDVNGDRVTFGLISSNVPKKGIVDVVELAEACATIKAARFLIIGPETDLVREIRGRQAKGDIPQSVEFADYTSSPQAAIEQVNVVLSFSHFAESFGRTALEAMAARRPVIAYRWGALPELVIEEVTGFLVPHLQSRLAASAIKSLCSNRARITEMGQAGRVLSEERFSRHQYDRQLKAAYDAVFASVARDGMAPVGARSGEIIERPRPRIKPPALIKPARALPWPAVPEHTRGPLRIAYFCWHFPVPSETFVLNELRYLVQQGHDVQVFCTQSPHPDFKPDFNIQWKRVSSPDELASELIATKRNVAHGHFVYPTVTEFLWPACEEAQIPFTFIAHAQDIFCYSNKEKNRIADIVASPLCLRLFVLSSFHREYVISCGVPPNKIAINPNAVDTSAFASGAIPTRSARAAKAVCAVHRFCEKKGLENLIRAGEELAKDGIRIDLYGYGPLEARYQSVISELGLGNVRLCGAVQTQEQLIALFREYDLFACPSLRAEDGDMDGIPTSIVEAMAAGLPVLTTATSGIPDLVTDGITGIVCEATPAGIADAVRRYYAMPASHVDSIIELARQRAGEHHDIKRLARVLLHVWRRKTIDIVIVSWTHAEQHREVLRRIFEYTSLPFHLIVSVNSDDPEVVAILEACYERHENITLVYNGYNAMVGPGTNHAIDAGQSEMAIYVCGREGFILRTGWELGFLHHMEENPKVGLAGTLCYAPNYLTGALYPTNIPLFSKFRNPSYANDNAERVFRHVQGGLFAIRRAMHDEIGGFSDAVPHDYTDVEYSYYVESCGWQLGEVKSIASVYNKTRPPLSARVDESVAAVHPATLQDIGMLDRIARGQRFCCNLCGWDGEEFMRVSGHAPRCPRCESTPADRTLYRWLTPSIYLFRRLPAIAIGLGGRMRDIWHDQFQGSKMPLREFLDMVCAGKPLTNRQGGLEIGVLRGPVPDIGNWRAALAELARLVKPGGVVLVQSAAAADLSELRTLAIGMDLTPVAEVRYGSYALQFDRDALLVWARAGRKGL